MSTKHKIGAEAQGGAARVRLRPWQRAPQPAVAMAESVCRVRRARQVAAP